MTPHQGAGAGQAIEVSPILIRISRSPHRIQDAYILAGILGNTGTTLDNIELALQAYDHVRRPIASHVLQGSRDGGRMYEFNGPHEDDYAKLGPAIQSQWDWIWASTPEEDVEKALAWMRGH